MSNSDDQVLPVEKDISEDVGSSKGKPKNRGKKRKRIASDSSTDIEDVLPENTLEMEKNLHASAIKNNLDDVSVRKILKKVVTNDHVLALVKLREEEEEASMVESNLRPKLTRAKAKELMKVSPKPATWNLELTPIKHIPVKTRPEVKALIAQELPEDEDDEEYEPTHEDVQSDEELGVESSDAESQPRTPSAGAPPAASPRHDGPFKLPQDVSTRKKLNLEEEATIALRTRSKLSLSATSIEHIESTFVPPDELPVLVGDDLWNQFLTDCLDPAHTSRHEDDDETDPEYNAAADPDAADEDEDAFGNSIMKISKKELSDLVTELFNIMPEATSNADLAEDLANSVLTEGKQPELEQVSAQWEGKKEKTSDDESTVRVADRIKYETTGASNMESEREKQSGSDGGVKETDAKLIQSTAKNDEEDGTIKKQTRCVEITLEEETDDSHPDGGDRLPPPPLRKTLIKPKTHKVKIQLDSGPCMLPSQLLILQQQLRQHVQLAASSFLQLYIHPVHWSYAPTYKDYLESLVKLSSKPGSVVSVCNLKPAVELVRTWETCAAADTPENAKMVEFIQEQADRSRRRASHNSLYVGEFHATLLATVANSPVFLYPYLLPAMPYRADSVLKRFTYLQSEDHLIALGLDQFWQYIEDNTSIFRPNTRLNPRHRWGLGLVAQLMVKHMFPWLTTKSLLQHIHHVRKTADKDNPICKFFNNREVSPVKHRLLPFNPELTLYEQPEHEVPRIWLRYLSKTSRRFRSYLMRRTNVTGQAPRGVEVDIDKAVETPKKNPLPIQFTREIINHRTNVFPVLPTPPLHDKFDLLVEDTTKNTESLIMVPQNPLMATPNKITVSPIHKNVQTQNTFIIPPTQTPTTEANTIIVPSSRHPRMTEKVFTLSPMVRNAGLPSQNTLVISPMVRSPVTAGQNTVASQTSRQTDIQDIIKVCPQNSGTSVNTLTVSPIVEDFETPVRSTVSIIPQNAAPTNFYKVVETSTGAFLVPLNSTSNAVDCTTAPIATSVRERTTLIANDLPESSNYAHPPKDDKFMRIQDSKEHCRCCVLLRRICRLKQTVITDYFTGRSKVDNKCPCSCIKYPRISRKLKLLLSFYRSKALSAIQDLDAKLKSFKDDDIEGSSSDWNLNELAYITTYQLKLTMRTNVARNNFIKRKVNALLSSFNIDEDDPIMLVKKLGRVFDVEMIDVYKEFLAFLTPEQADKMEVFKDYFIRVCVTDLVQKVEEHIPMKSKQVTILSKLNKVLMNNFATACEICFGLLSTVDGYPKLAEYIFSLFPHRVESRCNHQQHMETAATTQLEREDDTMETQDNNRSQLTMDYEADHSSSGEDENCDEPFNSNNFERKPVVGSGQQEQQEKSSEFSNTIIHTVELTIDKVEQQDSESSESMMIMSEEELVKTEPLEWKRDEDKLILEMLQQHLTPNELKDKTIIEIIEEKNIIGIIAESLIHKSISDIKERTCYLLRLL